MRFNVKRYFQVLGISLAVLVAAAAVCMGIDFTGGNDVMVDNTSTVEAVGGKINILLMGVDVDGLRTDAIMLASVDTDTKQVNMLSIPRDTRMYIGNRYQKINAAHAFVGEDGEIGGPTATCEAVTRLTGIPINYYIDFTFDGVAHVINELGPIDFEIPDLYGDGVGMVYDDPVQSLHINLPPGHYGEGGDYPGLNGSQAVWLMRYRHGNVDPDTDTFKGYVNGDTDRVAMQQKFLKAVVDQKVNAGLILKVPAIFKAISSEIKTNFTVSDVVKYSKYITDFSSENINAYSLPGEYATDKANGDVWVPDMDGIRELTETVFGYDASNISTGNPDDPESFEAGKETETVSQTSSGSSYVSSSKKDSSSSSGSSSSSSSRSKSSSSDDDDDDDYYSDDDDDDDDDYESSSSSSRSGSYDDDDEIGTAEYSYSGDSEDN